MTGLRTLAVYAALAGRHLFRGSLGDSLCFAKAFALRSAESLLNVFQPARVSCDICGWTGHHFLSYVPTPPYVVRRESCPKCMSLKRHRGLAGVLTDSLRRIQNRPIEILDIAPNPAISNWLRSLGDIRYLSIDLVSDFAMEKMDIQNMQLPDNRFDIVVCYHVLDYVPDDGKAINEIRRVLKPGGLFISQEGIDWNRSTQEWGRPLREQENRIRQYGFDFPDTVRAAGFTVESIHDRNGRQVFLFTKA